MILYTMMPEELIYPQKDEVYASRQIVTFNGVTLAVNRNNDGDYQIERILSTDPQHFLNSQYSPGQKITLT